MAFDLSNKAGDSIKVSGGHQAVFLTLAETFGWISAKTSKRRLMVWLAPDSFI